jgi:16S rRNA (cytosine967-C5)-methyltransferase
LPLPFGAIFDLVLIDAPCSGLGTVRRDPEIKWRRGPDEFGALAGLQGRILQSAAAAVRPGGRLVYSTCSSEPEENEAIVERFLAENPAFETWPLQLASAPQLINPAGHFRSYPFRDGLEAFFAASLVKAAGLR